MRSEVVIFWNGQVVDGRNRLKACTELGIEPRECELDDTVDPIAFVISANLHRRHLHPSQRAMIAAKMATLKRGGDRKSDDFKGPNGTLIDDAAKQLDIAPRQVKRAKYVLEHGSKDLIEAVESKTLPVSTAEKLCKACEDKREQSRLVKEGKKAIKEFLNPTPVDEQPPEDEQSDGEVGDKYEYPVVKMFRHADYRMNTLKMLIKELTETEKAVLAEWL